MRKTVILIAGRKTNPVAIILDNNKASGLLNRTMGRLLHFAQLNVYTIGMIVFILFPIY